MEVRDLSSKDRVPGVRFDSSYLRGAQAGGLYVALVAEEDGRIYGAAEAGYLLHTTRGPALRMRSVFGRVPQTFRPLLAAMRDRARSFRCKAFYAASAPDAPELCMAAKALRMSRLDGDIAMSRSVRTPAVDVHVPGVIVRPMHVDEYPDVFRRILPLVSGGDRMASVHELRAFLASGAFVPHVAEIDGEVVASAELNVFHSVLANCRVGRIERVAVSEKCRGRGISHAVVSALLEQASRAGCAKVDLLVRDGNAPAVRTYEKLGFVRADEIPYWLAL